jgi:hypothetical protein
MALALPAEETRQSSFMDSTEVTPETTPRGTVKMGRRFELEHLNFPDELVTKSSKSQPYSASLSTADTIPFIPDTASPFGFEADEFRGFEDSAGEESDEEHERGALRTQSTARRVHSKTMYVEEEPVEVSAENY